MTKQWLKTGDGKYSFSVDGIKTGWIDIALNTADRRATVYVGDDEMIIRRTSFWKSGIDITRSNNELIGKAYPKKWYANTMTVEYGDSKYDLETRNNPLAEWVLKHNGNDVLAYGLYADKGNGKIGVKISSPAQSHDYLLDFLLWYLFVPVAAENMGDDFTFLMLLTSAG